MGENVVLKEEINAVIKRKIDNEEAADEIKKFLTELLLLELVHVNDLASWHGYKDEYEDMVKKHAGQQEGEL
jgi:hypothetical protein